MTGADCFVSRTAFFLFFCFRLCLRGCGGRLLSYMSFVYKTENVYIKYLKNNNNDDNHEQNIQSKLIRAAGKINKVTIYTDCCGYKRICKLL